MVTANLHLHCAQNQALRALLFTSIKTKPGSIRIRTRWQLSNWNTEQLFLWGYFQNPYLLFPARSGLQSTFTFPSWRRFSLSSAFFLVDSPFLFFPSYLSPLSSFILSLCAPHSESYPGFPSLLYNYLSVPAEVENSSDKNFKLCSVHSRFSTTEDCCDNIEDCLWRKGGLDEFEEFRQCSELLYSAGASRVNSILEKGK